ncbi:MAG: DUF7487 domain-containing protein [Nitrososphaeraceae archaeon]
MRKTLLDECNNAFNMIGVKSRPSSEISRKNIKELIESTNYLPTNSFIMQRAWHLINNQTEMPNCEMCNNAVSWNKTNLKYRRFCGSKCANKQGDTKKTRTITNLERYGSVSSLGNENIKKKAKQTWLIRHGVDNPTKNPVIAKKVSERLKGTHNLEGNEIREKTKQTCLNKYGVDNPFKYPDFQDKIRKKVFEVYKVLYPMQSDVIKDKLKETNIRKYGVVWNIACYQSRQKRINTCTDKYGIPHASKYIAVKKLGIDAYNMTHNSDYLKELYINENMTCKQISTILNVSEELIRKRLHLYEIDIRNSIVFHSKMCLDWLEFIMEQEGINIQHAGNIGEYKIPGTRYKADGYCSETNTIYEFHGDYWHGNPKIFESTVINEVVGISMGELYLRTIEKENKIRELGYNLTTMWQTN